MLSRQREDKPSGRSRRRAAEPASERAKVPFMSFKLAINAAGAISAGAYTAGVLDFLPWTSGRRPKLKWKADPENGPVVPLHEASIEAFSGASVFRAAPRPPSGSITGFNRLLFRGILRSAAQTSLELAYI